MDLTISSIQRFVSPSFFSEGNKLVVVVLLSGKDELGGIGIGMWGNARRQKRTELFTLIEQKTSELN